MSERAYWTSLISRERTAGAIFLLSELNPTIGRPGEVCVNFVTHLRSRERPVFRESDECLMAHRMNEAALESWSKRQVVELNL